MAALLSWNRVKVCLEDADAAFLECWSLLCKLKTQKAEIEELFSFQPRLAIALASIDALFHEVGRNRTRLLARKANLSPTWLAARMRLLDSYRSILSEAGKRGRQLGDCFAWLFYSRDQECLVEHLRLSPNPHISDTLGGRVELDFVSRFPILGGHFFCLYHGITNLLRVGDVSLIDLHDMRVVGLAEIKAGPILEGHTKVRATFIGAERLHSLLDSSTSHADPRENSRGTEGEEYSQDSQRGREKRQLERMVRTIRPPSLDDYREVKLVTGYSALEGVVGEAFSSGIACRRINESLGVAVVLVKPRRISSRQTRPSGDLSTRRLVAEALLELGHSLVERPAKDASLLVGALSLGCLPGTIPLVWSPFPIELLDHMFKGRLAVITLYNPACFIEYLRASGFEVTLSADRRGLTMRQVIGQRCVSIEHTAFFLELLQNYMVDAESLARSIVMLVSQLATKGPSQFGKTILVPFAQSG